ncbi:MAG TPA: monovalent cation/H+ antiporter subunit D family protein [Rhodospirillales bacterium]|nr:monovalent cation/H+ antiporter subunit D family protein [Rhodospirillales bacterium]
MAANLPILQVIAPLLSAPLCVLLRRPGAAWAFALAVTWASFAIALTLLSQVLESGPISYEIGGWAAPFGIEYRVDMISAFVLVIVSAIGSAIMLFARHSVASEIRRERIYLFYAMYLLCLSGLLGIAITGDTFNLFVFLEISSLSSYVLISLGQDKRALTAAFRYLVMGAIGATFYIIGVGLMYMMTGTLNIADLAVRLPAVASTTTILAALAFLTVGISLKLALFPLHAWLPGAYAYAPSMVTAFMAATATKVAVYILIRILFTIFGGVDVMAGMHVGVILTGLAVIAMFAASTTAIFQPNLKRMLAYSSVAQIGYIILGISFASETGLAGGIIHLFNHAVTKSALFMVMGCVVLRVGSVNIRAFDGLGARMPLTMAAFVIAGLSLIGIPLTVGFISKWYLILAALEKGWWPIAVVVVLSSLLAVIYVWRVVEAAYFRPAAADAPEISEAPASMLIALWLMTGASVYFGVDATRTLDVALGAAKLLLVDRI